MSVATTSFQAYHAKKAKGDIDRQRSRVFVILQQHPEGLARFQIAEMMNMPESTVAARCNELIKMELALEDGDRRKNPKSGCSQKVVKPCEPLPGVA